MKQAQNDHFYKPNYRTVSPSEAHYLTPPKKKREGSLLRPSPGDPLSPRLFIVIHGSRRPFSIRVKPWDIVIKKKKEKVMWIKKHSWVYKDDADS